MFMLCGKHDFSTIQMTHVNEYALISVFLIFNDALRLRYLKIIIFYP